MVGVFGRTFVRWGSAHRMRGKYERRSLASSGAQGISKRPGLLLKGRVNLCFWRMASMVKMGARPGELHHVHCQ